MLTALWQDSEGYQCRRTYRPEELPVEYLPTLQGIVSRLVALEEPWQATHVSAAVFTSQVIESEEEMAAEPVESVRLTLTARRADGASRCFTCEDYPQLQLTDADSIRAFRQLAGGDA